MTYPMPQNITSIAGMMQYANTVTSNYFIIGLLLTIYIVPLVFFLLRNHDWKDASMTAGFAVAISAILLRIANILTVDKYVFFAMATIAIPLIISFIEEKW